MKSFAISLALGVVWAGCTSNSPTKEAAGESGASLTVLYAANRQGEVEPCGCQVNQLGGLHRMKAFLEKRKSDSGAAPLLSLDAGDTFFSMATLNEARRAQEMARSKTVAEGYRELGVQFLTPGERDFAGGLSHLRELERLSGTKILSANLVDGEGKALFPASAVVSVGSLNVGVVGLTSPETVAKVTGIRALNALESGKRAVDGLRKKGARKIILLSHSGLEEDRKLAAVLDVDLIVGAHSVDSLPKPELVSRDGRKIPIVQTTLQGQQAGLIELAANGEVSAHSLTELDKSWEATNALSGLIERYKEQVRVLALNEEKKSAPVAPTTAKHPYVANPAECRMCHQKQYDFWEGTKHASAYLALFAKNQHFDPECIACHSLGFEKPGGFSKIAQPIVMEGMKPKKGEAFIEKVMKDVFSADTGTGPLDSRVDPARFVKLKARYHTEIKKLEDDGKLMRNYLGVQCEHCHGNRQGHPDPKVPTQKKVSLESCKTCHTPPNAAVFDPATLPRVACPLASKL